MSSYSADRKWSDQYLGEIKKILAPHLITVAPDYDDQKQATDLKCRAADVAVRVRRGGYADKYRYQITMRSSRASGAETELSKVISGHGDLMIYAHLGEADQIQLWHLVSFKALRRALIEIPGLYGSPDGISSGEQFNGDGVTGFRWFDLRYFKQIVVASSISIDRLPMPGAEPQPIIVQPQISPYVPRETVFGRRRFAMPAAATSLVEVANV